MKEIVYNLDDFKKIVEGAGLDLKLLKLDFPERHQQGGIYGEVKAKLSIPYKNRILICEFRGITFSPIFLKSEQGGKEEGEETKRVKKYSEWVRSQVKEKLGVEATDGRWEE